MRKNFNQNRIKPALIPWRELATKLKLNGYIIRTDPRSWGIFYVFLLMNINTRSTWINTKYILQPSQRITKDNVTNYVVRDSNKLCTKHSITIKFSFMRTIHVWMTLEAMHHIQNVILHFNLSLQMVACMHAAHPWTIEPSTCCMSVGWFSHLLLLAGYPQFSYPVPFLMCVALHLLLRTWQYN